VKPRAVQAAERKGTIAKNVRDLIVGFVSSFAASLLYDAFTGDSIQDALDKAKKQLEENKRLGKWPFGTN
jgi:hypothetical protein